MLTISRGKALNNLMKEIYGNLNVNFKERNVIINDDGIRKTLFSPTSINNVRRLLEVTFKGTAVKFKDKKKGKNFDLDREKVIDNTTEYFRSFGIDIPNVVNKTERKLLGKKLCNALIEYLLPAVFSDIDTEKEKIDTEKDDISSKFDKAIQNIRNKFASSDFFEALYVDIKSSDVEKIYDSDYSKDECNYGIRVWTYAQVVFKELKIIPLVYYLACNNDSEQSEVSNLYSNTFDGLQKETEYSNDSFEELISGLAAKEVLDNINFVSPYYYNENHENRIDKIKNDPKEYRLRLNVKIPNSSFIPRYFYFLTKLNEDVVREKYPNCKSSAMLNNELMEKAIDKISTDYKDKITQYYKETLANIENIYRNFLSIDIESILSSKIQNVSDFKKALSSLCNENDIDEMWKICQEQHLSAEQTSRYIYCGIEEAIRDFSFLISDLSYSWVNCENRTESKSEITAAIEDYISKSDIKGHINTLTKLLRTHNIEGMSVLRKTRNFKWNPNAGIKMSYRNDSEPWPIHYPSTIPLEKIKSQKAQAAAESDAKTAQENAEKAAAAQKKAEEAQATAEAAKANVEEVQRNEYDTKDVYCCLKDSINLYCNNLKKYYRL